MNNNEFSFLRGWEQIESNVVKKRIKAVCKITSPVSWLQRLRGQVIPSAYEFREITKIFNEYGITDVWGVPNGK